MLNVNELVVGDVLLLWGQSWEVKLVELGGPRAYAHLVREADRAEKWLYFERHCLVCSGMGKLAARNFQECPRCKGTGLVPNPELEHIQLEARS